MSAGETSCTEHEMTNMAALLLERENSALVCSDLLLVIAGPGSVVGFCGPVQPSYADNSTLAAAWRCDGK